MRKRRIVLTLLAGVMLALPACDTRTVYDKYAHTPITGWEKNDTLSFNTSPIRQAGQYRREVGLRINGAYPFMSLRLIIEQETFPSRLIERDTLNCELINRKGTPKGQGISYYQYNFRIDDTVLQEDDSLRIYIRHDMKREILPGISDIGIKISRN